MSNKSTTAQQAITLPKGGGAVKGIGETFQANLFTGTGNHSVPIALSPGRNGFGPTLALEYSSGNGNGPFGLGWQLTIPRVTRKTEKGIPRYDDTDVFVLSGAEDLVPWLERTVDPGGEETWRRDEPFNRPPYRISRYRPRTEGLFARIERWENGATSEVHWRTITRDNVTSLYGLTGASRIADPDDEHRVHEWLLQETFDAYGNHILYEYARDNPELYTNEDPSAGLNDIFEHNRKATQLYIRRMYYGNLPEPLLDRAGNQMRYPDGTEIGHLREGRRYAFEVVFDYGDWNIPTRQPHPEPLPAGVQELFGPDPSVSLDQNPVPVREDRFSTSRAGFEIRTLRRCRRVLMFHHFAELGGPTLVRSTDFDYHNDADTRLSLLTAVTVTGYRKDGGGRYKSAGMPPVTFEYSEFRPQAQRYQSLTAEGNDLPPSALQDADVALVDLFGDGLPDVLQSGPAGFRYWKNLGDGRLDRPRSMPQIPAGLALAQPGVGFGDMAGDGRADLLVHSGPIAGFFEATSDGTWQTFRPYDSAPAFGLSDPNLRLLDLTGNGLSDALLTADSHFVWFECLRERGFAPPRHIARRHDLDAFPDVFFEDAAGRVRLADMSGDGLNDIVLIHNGRVDYWPNLGYGRFGKRLTMANAPRLEFNFDPGRLFLADLNGTGCADLVYVDSDRVHIWFNQSGNGWSDRHIITGTPIVTDVDSVQFADVFGTGTATLLWSYDHSVQRRGNYKALDFCGGVKPYVLIEMSNNMGATTRVRYAPSTRYLLEDQANRTPWVTRLPFPVQVVEKVEVIDHISRTKLVTTYKYHHGCFDGREREFRGFGRVDQFDTETFEDFSKPGLHGDEEFVNDGPAYHAPPVETRSWFHTGIYFDEDRTAHRTDPFDYRELTNAFRREFYSGDREAVPIGEHDVDAGDTPREAYRLLRGALLRSEVYAHDGSARAGHPYQVTENRYRVTRLQPRNGNHHAVYFSHQLETLSYHYERNPADPRMSHAMTLEVDAFGNPLQSLSIGYGRRRPDPTLPTQTDRDKQGEAFVTYTENSYTNAVDDITRDPDNYRTPLPSGTRTYELTGYMSVKGTRFSLEEWVANDFARVNEAAEIAYETTADPSRRQKRLIEHTRARYRRDDLADFLPFGVAQSLALPGLTYKLAFTPGLLAKAYASRVTDSMLTTDGGYAHIEDDANWWIPSARVFYSPHVADAAPEELAFAQRHFFSTPRSCDTFGHTALVRYDPYDLLLEETIDPLGNRTTAGHDYRVLQPFRTTDMNGNRAEVAFDTLGLVAGTAVMGKASEAFGDSLAGFEPDPPLQQVDRFMARPRKPSSQAGESEATPVVHELLQNATTRIVYDLHRYLRTQQPVLAATLARETHASDPQLAGGLEIQVSVSYADGFGREIQKKMQAEPGPVVEGGPIVRPRWVGTGWTIFNNKGKPVKQYEPFFDDTHDFRFGHQAGVSSTLFYDPVERVVATLHPDHTWDKVVFDAWRQETWDVSDTVLVVDPRTDPDVGVFFRRLPESDYLPTWYSLRTDPVFAAEAGRRWPDQRIRDAETNAAEKTSVHAATPGMAYADSLGRPFLTIAHNRFKYSTTATDDPPLEEFYITRVILDIEGSQRKVADAKGRLAMQYDYDMLATRIHQASMEAGDRWTLNDVAGQPIHTWDSRGHRFHTTYDPLRRPVDVFLREGDGPELLVGRTVYGDTQASPESKNLRGKVFQVLDQAGCTTSEAYDFKGNLLAGQRRLAREYKTILDWSTNPDLEPAAFTTLSSYDALNRLTSVTSADGSVYRPTFNEANLLEKVDLNLRGAPTSTAFVTGVDYDSKGQRARIEYGNGVRTTYEYDPLTFRLTRLRTLRGPERLQDLRYTYDASGNVSEIRDSAQQTIYFTNTLVAPHTDYAYDALYRLTEATGREHIGQHSQPETTWDDRFRVGLAHPHDGQAMRRYTERYEYDAVGNVLAVVHQARNGSWTRRYGYSEPSQIEPTKPSNRLTSTHVGGGTADLYRYDVHGNMTIMPHLSTMQWDFENQLRMTSRQVVTQGAPETTYYVYDGSGQRVRKITERLGDTRKNARIYIGGVEVYREYGHNGTDVTLERETLQVMDDKQRVALVETRTAGDDGAPAQLTRYQCGNHLGSATLELDGKAALISYEEYYPFGSTSYQSVRSRSETPKQYRFSAAQRDEETGLSYHRSRYVAPWIGRWTSPDPAFLSDGINLYAYVDANPVRYSDPNGTDSLDWIEENVLPPLVDGAVVGVLPRDFVNKSKALINARNLHDFKMGVAEGAVELGRDALRFAATLALQRTPEDIDRTTFLMCTTCTPKHFKKVNRNFARAMGEGHPAGLNRFNPVYHLLVAVYEGSRAYERKDYREAGRRTVHAVANLAATVELPLAITRLGYSTSMSGPKKPGSTPTATGTPAAREPAFLRSAPEESATASPVTASTQPPPASRWGNWSLSDTMRGSPYKATQRTVYRETVEQMADEMNAGTFDWANMADPIMVDSRGLILQGHHRVVAARLANKPIPRSAIRTVSVEHARDPRPWSNVALRPGKKP